MSFIRMRLILIMLGTIHQPHIFLKQNINKMTIKLFIIKKRAEKLEDQVGTCLKLNIQVTDISTNS